MRVYTEVPGTREPLFSKGSRLFRLARCKQVRRQIHECAAYMALPGSRSRTDDRFSASLNGLFDVSQAVLHHRDSQEGSGFVKGSQVARNLKRLYRVLEGLSKITHCICDHTKSALD